MRVKRRHLTTHNWTRRARTGTSSVELALVLPILTTLLLGIIEMGIIVDRSIKLNQAAREVARSAAVGASLYEMNSRAEACTSSLDPSKLVCLCETRTYDSWSGSWGPWYQLGGSGDTNDAAAGDQVRVSLDYAHTLVSGGLFAAIADGPDSQTLTLRSNIVVRRE